MSVQETNYRSLMKSITYRLLSTFVTTSIIFGITRQGRVAVTFAVADSLLKIALYYIHERAWTLLPFGRRATHRLEKLST